MEGLRADRSALVSMTAVVFYYRVSFQRSGKKSRGSVASRYVEFTVVGFVHDTFIPLVYTSKTFPGWMVLAAYSFLTGICTVPRRVVFSPDVSLLHFDFLAHMRYIFSLYLCATTSHVSNSSPKNSIISIAACPPTALAMSALTPSSLCACKASSMTSFRLPAMSLSPTSWPSFRGAPTVQKGKRS